MLLKIETKQIEPSITVLELSGRFALGREGQRVQWQVEELVRANVKKIILDLSRLEQVDSMGVGVIVFCAGRLKQSGGELLIAGAQGLVEQVLKVTKVDAIVGMYPTTVAAAEAFSLPGQLGQHA